MVVENTHSRGVGGGGGGGGVVFPQEDVDTICGEAHELSIATYLDGARLFNSAAASGRPIAELAAPFDLVSIALSKGLGCPVGSVIAGRFEDIKRAVRARRMFGGAMRQSGILAAAGIHALEHNRTRLAEDHAHARIIAEGLAATPVLIDLGRVQTNIVVFCLPDDGPDAATVMRRAADRGLLISAFAARTVRAVTHLNVSAAQCLRAVDILASVVEP